MKVEFPFSCPSCGAKGQIDLVMDQEPKRTGRREKERREKEPTPFFQEMVDHIDKAWLTKKKAKFHWRPQFFRDLKSLASTYTPFGVMALYDCFLHSDDDWVKSTGYSFQAFITSIPKILDNMDWKRLRRMYEEKFMPTNIDLAKTIAGIVKPASTLAPAKPAPFGSPPRPGAIND